MNEIHTPNDETLLDHFLNPRNVGDVPKRMGWAKSARSIAVT
jgi:hypothetical protein